MSLDQRLRSALGEDRGSLVTYAKAQARHRATVVTGRALARISPRRLERPPVLLVGCPRSGTTLLFDLVRRHPDLASLEHEGHVYWDGFNHPRRHGWRSDVLEAGDVRPGERRYVESMMTRSVGKSGHGRRRPLDKTPKNALRMSYLRSLLPDAQVVVVLRDGPPTVASLLEGWRTRHGASYRLPQELRLADYDSRLWRYVLPPGWEQLQGTDLPSVATAQYVACAEALHRDLSLADAVLTYEDLVADPVATLTRLLSDLDLPPSTSVLERARELPSATRSSWSPPRADKWRAVASDLEPHLDRITAASALLGYSASR